MIRVNRGVCSAITTVLVWAAAYPAIAVALVDIEPGPLGAARFAIAAVPMLAFLAWTRPRLPLGWDLLRFAASAALGIAGYNLLLNTGQQSVGAGAASFLIKFESVVTVVLAVSVLGETLGRNLWIGTAVCLAGAVLIASDQPGGLRMDGGAALVLVAAVSSSISFVIQKRLVATYGALTTAAVNIVMGAVLLLPWLQAGLAQAAAASGTGLGALLFLGLFPAAIGYATWMATMEYFGVARASNLLYLVPPVAMAIAYLLSGELPGWPTLAGGVLLLGGVALVNFRAQLKED